jgi:hypothetical protein
MIWLAMFQTAISVYQRQSAVQKVFLWLAEHGVLLAPNRE